MAIQEAIEHYQARRLSKAEAICRQILRIEPNNMDALHLLGLVAMQIGKAEVAVKLIGCALKIKPDFAEAHLNLGLALQDLGQFDEAMASFYRALKIKPDFAEVRWTLTMSQIPLIPYAHEEIEACRTKFIDELVKLNEWFDTERAVIGYETVGNIQPFFLAYQEDYNRDILFMYGALCARLMKHWQDKQTFTHIPVTSNGLIRVGIVSAHIHKHSVWHAIVKGWLTHLDRNRIELHIFHVGSQQDDETNWANTKSDSFEQWKGSMEQWAESIQKKNVDVLIYPEIGMDPMTGKLASLRLAPIQMASWGHPETTGLPTIDYYLSAEYLEPPDAQNNYTEKLICLPNLGCYYHPEQVNSSAPDFAGLGIDAGVPLLLCPGAPFKYAPQHDHVFVEIANKLGGCQFVFFTYHFRGLSEKLCQRLEFVFAKHNMNFNDYCTFIPWQEKAAFYGLMERADVFLDTIGFSGFNTAMQAVECGLPIVTREGRFMRGRLASGILRRIGLTELITNSENEYVNLAVKIAQDTAYRRDIRKRIETSRQILFDDIEPVRALEDFLINVVERTEQIKSQEHTYERNSLRLSMATA